MKYTVLILLLSACASKHEADTWSEPPKRPVCVARTEIQAGQVITSAACQTNIVHENNN